MSLAWVAILGVALVVATATLAPKVGIAAPLLLVGLGYAVSLLPAVDGVVVDPEWVLAGLLPPLLGTYPSALLDAALAQLDADQLGIELIPD